MEVVVDVSAVTLTNDWGCSGEEPGDGALHPQREGGGGGLQDLHRPGSGVGVPGGG